MAGEPRIVNHPRCDACGGGQRVGTGTCPHWLDLKQAGTIGVAPDVLRTMQAELEDLRAWRAEQMAAPKGLTWLFDSGLSLVYSDGETAFRVDEFHQHQEPTPRQRRLIGALLDLARDQLARFESAEDAP